MRPGIEDLFHAVADLPIAARQQYFQEHDIDAATQEEIEALVAFDVPTAASFLHEIGDMAQQTWERFDGNGKHCGPYLLSQTLGRGGMGTVHLAERVDGEVTQRVAIKLLRPGVDDSQIRKRFLAERQILAKLSHPNIAHLLDVGHREDGQPYLVLEYVEGKAIDAYCAELGIRQKVALFLKVCATVSYLHRNLVVHRDLKPSNILVTADGEPKLLDFGIAKILDWTADATVTGMRMLTPDYASPEQVVGGPVTTATDTYSLGAVLYKLLTGVAPHVFDGKSPEAIALAIATGKITPPAKLMPALKGDLEVILMKALRLEPHERYASVEQFSDDLENYLATLPIRARSGDAWYRTRKFLRRRWLPVAAAALAAAGLFSGVLIANYQRAIAQQRFSQVRQLANVFLFDFERSIRDVPGTLDARNLVASTGQRYLKQLAAESRYDPSLEREIANGYERLVDIQESLQSGGVASTAAIDSLLQALEIHRRLGDDRSPDPALRRKYIDLASYLGHRYQAERNSADAVKWSDTAMKMSEELVTADPRNKDALAAAAAAFMRAANTKEVSGQISDALQVAGKAVKFGEGAVTAAPQDDAVRISVSEAYIIFANLLGAVERYPDAIVQARRSLQLMEPLWASHPDRSQVRLMFSRANSAVGDIEHELGLSTGDSRHFTAGLPYLQRTCSLAGEAMHADPKSFLNKDRFVVGCSRLCSLYVDMKNFSAATQISEQITEVSRELTVVNPNNRRSWYLYGKMQLDAGWMYLGEGQPAKAQAAFSGADAGLTRGLAIDPADAILLECRVGQLDGMSQAAWALKDREEARRRMQQCFEVIRNMIRRDPSAKSYIKNYAEKLKFAREIGVSTAGLE